MADHVTFVAPAASRLATPHLAVRDGQRTKLAPGVALIAMCGHGERAMTAASILTARGLRDVTVLDGGPDTGVEWSGRPLAIGA